MSNDQCNMIMSMITSRMDRIENKVDSVLKFKWQIMGGAGIIGSIIGIFVTIGFSFFKGGM